MKMSVRIQCIPKYISGSYPHIYIDWQNKISNRALFEFKYTLC